MTGRYKLAVYGTLMTGERYAQWTADALDRKFCTMHGTLYYDMAHRFPTFVPDDTGGEVKAELLTVTDTTLARLDMLVEYPHLYRRENIKVILGDNSKAIAMVYIMNALSENTNERSNICVGTSYHGLSSCVPKCFEQIVKAM